MANIPPLSIDDRRAGDRRQNFADFRLTMDGVDLTAKVRPRLISLRLTEKRGGEADDLDLVLDDSDGKLQIPRKGVLISLALGWGRGSEVAIGLVDKGRFTVDDAGWDSAPGEITIKARSADLTAGYRVRRERSDTATTLGALARRVAGAHGLKLRIAPELAAIAVPVVVQDQQSDMALIRRLGREHDAIAKVADRTLILAPIGAGITASGIAIPSTTIIRSAGDRATWKSVERDAYTKVEARWHDQASAARKTAAAPVRGSNATSAAGDAKTRRLPKTYHTKQDAEAAAKAEAGRIARRGAELTLDLPLGRPDLYPDRKVKVSGFKPQIDATGWLIAELTHSLDGQGGLSTSLKMETA